MKRVANKHVRAFEEAKLNQEEEVACFLHGWIGNIMGKGDNTQHNGVLLVTNQRVLFYRKGLLGEVLETIPISKISSVETFSMMGYRVLKFHTSHNDLAFKTFEEKDVFQQAYEKVETLRLKSGSRGAETSSDPISKIRELASLRDEGLLTDAEFDEKKSELLGTL